jgi:hypothetical protein
VSRSLYPLKGRPGRGTCWTGAAFAFHPTDQVTCRRLGPQAAGLATSVIFRARPEAFLVPFGSSGSILRRMTEDLTHEPEDREPAPTPPAEPSPPEEAPTSAPPAAEPGSSSPPIETQARPVDSRPWWRPLLRR